MKSYQLYINGEFVAPQSAATIDVIDPATTEVIARVPDASAADVDRAVKAARAAFDEGPWRDVTAQDRGRILFKLAQIVRDRADELAELETRNSGKPIVEAEFDIADVATCFEYYGGMATKIHGDVLPVPDNAMSLALREPIGVAGPDRPVELPAADGGVEAGAGDLRRLHDRAEAGRADAAHRARAGVELRGRRPSPGVVNIVTGVGETAGAAIVEHPDVDKIAFTGSAEVGKIIMRGAAGTLKKISLELGGKSPNIFFADADFEAAVDGALFGVFINQGEVCSAGSRILVQRPIYKKFVDAMAAKAKTITLGHGMDRETKMGPLVSREQFDRVRAYQEIGKGEAKLALGGGRATGGALDRGYFVEPTIFYDVDNSSRIAREEIFGPVACVIPFDDEQDALRIANDTLLRARRRRVDPRYLPRHARRQEPARGHRVGQPHAADLRRGAVGRLQAERHRPRAGQVGRRRISQRQAGVHQPVRRSDQLVLTEASQMNYYGSKELADAFRTVRKNTIQIAEDIPEDKYDFKAVARIEDHRADAGPHRRVNDVPDDCARRQAQRHEQGGLPGAVRQGRRRGSQAPKQGGYRGAAEDGGRQICGPARNVYRSVSWRGSSDAARRRSAGPNALRHAARGEGARDAPSRPADGDAANDRRRAAPDPSDAGADGADAGGSGEVMPAAAPRFTAGTLSFLRRLKRNNRREWFNAHRDEYERDVREPMIAVIERLAIDFRSFAPELVASPKLSLYRIYRDTRFSETRRRTRRTSRPSSRAAACRNTKAPGCTFTSRPTTCGPAGVCGRRPCRNCRWFASTSP